MLIFSVHILKRVTLLVLILFLPSLLHGQAKKRARDYGVTIGVMTPGALNAITDVRGVTVGHTTRVAKDINTGVTAILPHKDNVFQEKVPAAVFIGNGFGKLVGSTQVQELGALETPVILTNTLSVGVAMDAVVEYTLNTKGNEDIQSVNAVVGETNDGFLNDIRGRHVSKHDVINAIMNARGGAIAEGNVGAGTGTVCFGFKGGIGTASRMLPKDAGAYTVGVLVQTNFGGVLRIDGVPVGEELGRYAMRDQLRDSGDGSCMIVVATDAPLDARNLERLAKRAFMGLAKTGGIASNGSGDYVIAFSTDPSLRIPYQGPATQTVTLLNNDAMSPLFMAAIEATEEAIINSLFAAETVKGKDQRLIEAMPAERVIDIMKKYNAVQ